MEVGKLTVKRRHQSGKGAARRLRSQGLVPGICYGVKLDTPVPIILDPKELRGALDPDKRHNTVIEITFADDSEKATVMLRDYQLDPIRREITHVDLIAIDTDMEIEASVPVEVTGKSPGVVDGGTLHFVTHEITVRCRPAAIPTKFVLDVGGLHIGEALHVSDLSFPEGVRPIVPERTTLITCTAPEVEKVTAEAEAEPAAAAAPAAKAAPKAEGGDKDKK
jgi:large subunit ribosomal protein L25